MDPNEEEVLTNAPEGEPAAPAPATPAPPAPEPPEDPAPEAPSQNEDEPEDKPVSTGSPRLDKRIERFSMKLRNDLATRNQPSQEDPYKPADLSDMEYDPETLKLLEEDREKIRQDAYRRGAGERQAQIQERFMDRFEIDADRVIAKYPVMDEDNAEAFDPDLTASINQQFLALTGWDEKTGRFHNPVIRYKDFVDSQMALIERAAASRNADTAQNVAKQVSRTGVRPTGGSRKTSVDLSPQGIAKMSVEEYEKHRPAIEAEIRRSMGI